MIAVAVVSLILGGYLWMTKPRSVELRRAPQPLRANVDHEIFDIVLSDLLVNKQIGFPGSRDGQKQAQIVLSAITDEGYPENLEDICGVLGGWISENKMDRDVLQNCADRNPPKVRFSLADYTPSTPSILVRVLGSNEYGFGFYDLHVGSAWIEPQLPVVSYRR
jgi:hypothetical protein